jgi:dethiobiotin synthetase
MARPIVVIGTGTAVGKTYVAERLLRGLAHEGRAAYGYKPVESGVTDTDVSDAARLARASSFHVKHSPVRAVFTAPISPHLATRDEQLPIDLPAIRAEVFRLASLTDVLVVELPGGAFSPVTDGVLVAHFARSLPDARILLVASDRLGVLHDVGATSLACAALGLLLDAVVLSAPETPDLSTGRNAAELPLVTRTPLHGTFRRAPSDAPLAPDDPAISLARHLTR